MILVLILMILCIAGSFAAGTFHASREKAPELTPVPTRPVPELPTRNERWLQEQEHELYSQRELSHTQCRVCGPGPLKNLTVPSLYDHPIKWRAYKRMLRSMYKAGIVEKGFYKVSVGRGATHLHPPWVEKPEG